MLQVSKFSSIDFNSEWKLPFQIQETYLQRFSPLDKPRVQYVDDLVSTIKVYQRIDSNITEITPDVLTQNDTIKINEFVLDLTGLSGEVEIYFNDGENKLLSSIFIVSEDIENTVLLEYTHRRNDFDTVFNLENKFYFRVEGVFLPNEYSFDNETEYFRDQRYKAKTLSSFPIEKKKLSIGGGFGVPNWVARLVNNIFSLSNVHVNGNRTIRSDGSTLELSLIHNDYPLYVYKIDLETTEDEEVADILSLIRVIDQKKNIARTTGESLRAYNILSSDLGFSGSKMIRELIEAGNITDDSSIEIDVPNTPETMKYSLSKLREYLLYPYFEFDPDNNAIKAKYSFYSVGGVSALGSGIPVTGGSGASSMGELINVGSWADQIQPEDIVMVKLADATHWSYKPLSDLFDTDKLAEYLSTNKYATQDWVEDKNYLTDSSISSLKTDVDDLKNLLDWFGVDDNGNVFVKENRSFYTLSGGISANGAGVSGGSGGSYSLSELIDVELSNLAAGQLLKYDGTHWINFDQSEITPDLTGYATESWVTGKGYITASALVGYATESWVNEQGFLKSSALDNYVNLDGTQSITGTKSFTADTTIFKSVSINGFLIDTDGNGNLRLNGNVYSTGGVSAGGPGAGGGGGSASSLSELSDVSLSGLTAGQLLKYNGSHWVNFDQSEITPDLTGYATESWVQSQGYLTEHQDLSGYLPSSGGTMTGDIIFNNNVNIRWKNITGDTLGQLYFNNNNILVVGNRSNAGLVLRTGSTDIFHDRNGDSYKVWDSFNLPNPAGSTDLNGYLPLTAGATKPLTGQLFANQGVNLPFNVALRATNEAGDLKNVIYSMTNNKLVVGDASYDMLIASTASDLIHSRTGTAYKIWDSYNLSNPAKTSDLANYIPRAAENNIASLLTKPGGIYRQGASVDGEFGYSCNMLLRFDSGGTNWYTGGILSISTGGELRVAGVSNGTLSVWRNMAAQEMVNNFLYNGNEVTFISQAAALPGVWLNYRGCAGGITDYLLGSGKADGSYANLKVKNLYTSESIYIPNGQKLKSYSSEGNIVDMAYVAPGSNVLVLGHLSTPGVLIRSTNTDIYHARNVGDTATNYKIWDAYNLSSPVTGSDGVAGQLAKWSAATTLSGGIAYSSGNVASTVVARDGNGAFAATSISVKNLNATNLGTGGGNTIIHVGLIPRINNACYIGNSTYQFAQVYSANYNIKLSNGTDRITLMNYQDRLSIAKNGGADTMGVNIGSLLVSGNLSDYTKVPTYGIYVSGNIVANGGVSAAGVSDARLKHDINPLDDALSLINMVKVKTFRYNSIARELDNNLPVRDAGFIAQEFVKVFPEHVKEMYDGKYLGIRYDKMIPYLTRGIQEVDNNTRKIKQVTVEILDIIGSTGIGEPVKMKIHELLNTLNTIR